LKADDLTFTNLEFPLDPTLPKSTYPRFNNHPGYVKAAIEAGIEVFSLANNHTNDQGVESIFRTLDAMESIRRESSVPVYFSGARDSLDKDFEPTSIRLKGWHIGYLAVTGFQNIRPPQPYVLEISYSRKQEADAFVDKIREIADDYDLFVLSYHGGIEYAPRPSPRKAPFFRRLLEAGVDIIHGHHPHVLQPVETVWRDGLNRVIFHSLGNFISGQGWRIDPYDPENEWAFVGDSAIFTTTISMTPRGATVARIESVLTTNLKTPNWDVVVEPLAELAETLLNEPWADFYRQRSRIVADFLREGRTVTRDMSSRMSRWKE
jgi:poly-gamma-glutamate synthesis protein (capsule biosynthesis protein)